MALVLLTSLSACELFKPLQSGGQTGDGTKKEDLDPIRGRRVYDPNTGTYVLVRNAPSGSMDTVRWKEIPSTVEPPIYSTSAPVAPGPSVNPVRPIGVGEGNSQLLSSYNVAVVLPFLTDRFTGDKSSIPANSEWALQFYNGMRMAFDDLSAQNIPLNVSVIDSKANERHVSDLARTNSDINAAHLIIGPYVRTNVAVMAEKAKSNGSVLVSPNSAASNISANNPNFIQIKPTLESHCQAIMRHVLKDTKHDQIVLVSLNTPTETARFEYLQREYDRVAGAQNKQTLRRITVDSARLDMSGISLNSYLNNNGKTVFIVPSWSQEVFVFNFLRKLDVTRTQNQEVAVYGMPQWMDYEIIDFDFYERLNVHVSSSAYIDDLNADVRAFKRKYFDSYGDLPREEAFVGYDLTRYFGKMLNTYGTRFQYKLPANPEQVLHTRFDFQSIILPATTGTEFRPVERWENKHVNILRFKDYRFTLVN